MAIFGTYPAPPGGNDDFTPGSVIASSEHDGNFGALESHLNSTFVADDVTADGALNGSKITDNTITGQQISRKADPGLAAISQNHLELLSVGTPELIDLSVTTPKLALLAVTDAQINDVDGAKIQAGTIPAAALGPEINFPISVSDEVIQFPVNDATVALAASNVEPVNITVTGVGGAPVYTEGVDWQFVGPNSIQHISAGGSIPTATNIEVDYTAAASGPPTNSVGSPQIINDSIVDSDINSGAAIQLSKLAVDPLARANHTGTQIAATISDFATATQSVAVGGDVTGTVGSISLSADSVDTDEIAQLPNGEIWRNGTGTPLATPGTWQPVYYPNGLIVAGMAIYNDGSQDAGFTVPVTGRYLITGSAEFTFASATSATSIGVRIYNIDAARTLAKDVQGWNGDGINPGAGCSVVTLLNAGDRVITEFNAIGDNPVPDIDSRMSISWMSD